MVVGGPFELSAGPGPEIDNLISVHFDTVAPRKKNLIWLQSHLKIG